MITKKAMINEERGESTLPDVWEDEEASSSSSWVDRHPTVGSHSEEHFLATH